MRKGQAPKNKLAVGGQGANSSAGLSTDLSDRRTLERLGFSQQLGPTSSGPVLVILPPETPPVQAGPIGPNRLRKLHYGYSTECELMQNTNGSDESMLRPILQT